MKNIIASAFFLLIIIVAIAQDSKSVFTTTDIVWYGVDFTNASFVSFDQAGNAGYEVKGRMMPDINALIIREQPKFDFNKAFYKTNVTPDIKSVSDLNGKIEIESKMVNAPGTIQRSTIDAMVKKYTGDKKKGIGLSFIVENFNKSTQTADIYVVFFDIATGKVLVCEKMTGKAAGVGLRNYWAGAIKSVLKQVETKEYKKWQAKY